MKKSFVFIGAALALIVGGIMALTSCNKNKGPYNQDILAEYIPLQPSVSAQSYDSWSAYFDLSDGMLSAYKEPATEANIKAILNKLIGNPATKHIYQLKSGEIEELSINDPKGVYNYIMEARNYRTVAPIAKALKQITSKNEAALLITDYEEYENGRIQKQSYAQTYFTQWVKKGNVITFFIIDYKEKGQDKHLYITVFDTPEGKLLSDVKEAMEGNQKNYKTFNLCNDMVEYKTAYDGLTRGGSYFDENDGDIVSCTNYTDANGDKYAMWEELRAEYYPFMSDWAGIASNAKAMAQAPTPFKHLLSGLAISFKKMSGYKVTELGIKVYNIQADYQKYRTAYETSLAETGTVSVKGYKPAKSSPEVKGMLEFKGSVNVAERTATVAIDLAPSFAQAKYNQLDMLRVDVLIDDCSPIDRQKVRQFFAWGDNESLSDAVFYTLQACNPKGKVLYSYYITAY